MKYCDSYSIRINILKRHEHCQLFNLQVRIRSVHLETEVESRLLPFRELLDLLVLSQLIWVCVLLPQWVLFLLLSGHSIVLLFVDVHPSDNVRDSLNTHRHTDVC